MIVGQKYRVPTVRGEPVLLPKHTDSEFFNFHIEHYHYDFRFKHDVNMQVVLPANDLPVIYEDRECIRNVHPVHPGFVFSLWKMMIHYRHERLICGSCPHKGIKTGEGTCPGHGLIWDSEGRLKHRDSRLYLAAGFMKQEIGWTYEDYVGFNVTASAIITTVKLMADNDELGSMKVGHVICAPGDIIKFGDKSK